MDFTVKQDKDGRVRFQFSEPTDCGEDLGCGCTVAAAERMAAANLVLASSQAMGNALLSSSHALSGSFQSMQASTARAIKEIYSPEVDQLSSQKDTTDVFA